MTAQPSLFDTPAHPQARRTDPWTSLTAAKTVRPGVPAQILDVMHQEPTHAFTPDELQARIRARRDTLRGAVSRLAGSGRIVPVDVGVSDAGCPMTRYRLP